MVVILNRGSESDRAALRIWTTSNRHFIDNERPEEERSAESLRVARQIVNGISPTAKCRSLTAMYNCVGFVFACRRTDIDCPSMLDMILRDDGYRRIQEEEAVEGDVVVYRQNGTPNHVGIIYDLKDMSLTGDGSRVEHWVLSQWGQDGEYLHKMREVPVLYGNTIEFWTERRPEQ